MKSVIGILILFYNKFDQTIECIESFLPSGQNIYILNNGSDKNQWKKLHENFKLQETVVFLDAGANLGVSGGRNYLIKYTKEPWIFSVDNDIQVRPANNWFKIFKNFVSNTPTAKIISPALFNVHENSWSQQLILNKSANTISVEAGNIKKSNIFPGGASIVHRSVFDMYGLYDEEMFVGFEDYEFGLRAIVSGKGELKVYHCEGIELVHDHRFQKKSNDKEAVRQRYNEEKLKASYDRMVSKYDIVFDHDWKWWTQKQVADMTQSKKVSQLKSAIKKILRK